MLFTIGFMLMLPRFFYRMIRRGGYARDFGQRLGFYREDVRRHLEEGGRVWVHAVSVGEIYVALKLMKEWRQRRPDLRFVLSTTTSTGYAIARKQIQAPDTYIYFPVDSPPVIRRILRLIRPRALILVELELWPNLVRWSRRLGVPVALVNGRISDHSFGGYLKLKAFTRRILPMIDVLCAQSRLDAERLLALGAPADRVQVLGSAKYDVAEADRSGAQSAREALDRAGIAQGRAVILGGSTWDGEEAILFDAFKALRGDFPDLALVVAPRHVERSARVAAEAAQRDLSVVRRTVGNGVARADVLLLDTTGELKNFYACADAIFVGKSLTQSGGQNIIEPAMYGRPVIVGPNMENFRGVVEDFRRADAIVEVQDAAGLREALRALMADAARREAIGRRAEQVVRDQTGVVGRSLSLIDPLVRA
jgi:3-deoxy-D-manno-octulosonic-acid transferase